MMLHYSIVVHTIYNIDPVQACGLISWSLVPLPSLLQDMQRRRQEAKLNLLPPYRSLACTISSLMNQVV